MSGTNFSDGLILRGGTINTYLANDAGHTILARCTVANLPTGAGYALGCLIQATDTGGIYTNTGTTSVASFVLLDSASASLVLPAAATDATTTTTTSLNLTQNAVTTGNGILQSLNGLTTGKGHSITHTTAVIASGGALLHVSSTSVDTGTTTGNLLNLSSTGSLAGTQVLLTASALTTGIGMSIVTAALTTGTAMIIPHTTSVIAAGGSLLRISSTGVNTTTTTGALLDLSSTLGVAATQFLGTYGVTTGIGQSIVANSLTSGQGLLISSSATAMTSTGRLFSVSHSGNAGVSTIIGEVSSAAADETIVFQSTASAAITGSVLSASATATVTGIVILATATAATMTTGRYFSANDASTEVFGIGANGHIHSKVSAAPPTIAVSQQNGITAAAITAGGTDTCGVITTTGTNNNGGTTILQVTFGKTYTTAPKAVLLFPANSAASKIAATSLLGAFISAKTATTFDITLPQDAGAVATPSWTYVVIA